MRVWLAILFSGVRLEPLIIIAVLVGGFIMLFVIFGAPKPIIVVRDGRPYECHVIGRGVRAIRATVCNPITEKERQELLKD